MAGAIDTILGRFIAHGTTMVCTDLEVKGQNSGSRSNFFSTVCIGSMGLPAWELHVNLTVIVLVN